MQLIVDSGSSHSTWAVVKDGDIVDKMVLNGINVNSNPKSIETIHQIESKEYFKLIKSVFFYGSGVTNQKKVSIIENALGQKFPNAALEVTNDILGACRAQLSKEASIVSILGTGVNTVVFDGTSIFKRIKSLGFYLAEEGSGFNLGRLVILYYLRDRMEKSDKRILEDNYLMETKDLIDLVYTNPKPNFYIASFSKFLKVCSKELSEEIISKNFKSYFKNHILPIDNYKNYRINLVGSIAFHFQESIREMATNYGIEVNNVLQNPIDGLIQYHSKIKHD